MSSLLNTLCFAVLCGLSFHTSASDYHADRTHLVDQNENLGTYLFRGNTPLAGDKNQRRFVYEKLAGRIRAGVNHRLDLGFYLVDLSLINRVSPDENRDLNIESGFFENFPEKGALAHHAITGQLVSYPEVLKNLGKYNDAGRTDSISFPFFIDTRCCSFS